MNKTILTVVELPSNHIIDCVNNFFGIFFGFFAVTLCYFTCFDFGFEKLEDIYSALIVKTTFRVVEFGEVADNEL